MYDTIDGSRSNIYIYITAFCICYISATNKIQVNDEYRRISLMQVIVSCNSGLQHAVCTVSARNERAIDVSFCYTFSNHCATAVQQKFICIRVIGNVISDCSYPSITNDFAARKNDKVISKSEWANTESRCIIQTRMLQVDGGG